jgi:alkylation response protein AidB-like acyl-CoA dehydrogenase
MPTFHFALRDLPPAAEALRDEVRAFLHEQFGGANPVKRARSWGGFDREFSRRVGERGWIGMTWPKQYGGHERTFLERYVVLEEMLAVAAGAPVSAHWIADRQSGPLLLRFGTEAQRQKILPRIVRGELAFAIGMSEPDSGSDLASIRTRATKTDGGYLVNGTKVWTSNAHLCDYLIALFRTQVVPDKKHEGLTQFLVDLKNTKGITIRPIIDLAGHHHFNEVNFTDAFIPEDMRVGNEGDGWKQVTTELAFERSGPERYLSSIALIRDDVRAVGAGAGPRAPRRRADTRDRLRSPTGARLHHTSGAVVFSSRRHAGSAARHHRARAGAAMSHERVFEERHGSPGALRTLGGVGGHVGAPHVNR